MMQGPLTDRELQVLHLITLGYSNVQIAKILNITLHTVKAHVQSILCKMPAKNRVQAAVMASKNPEYQNESVISKIQLIDFDE